MIDEKKNPMLSTKRNVISFFSNKITLIFHKSAALTFFLLDSLIKTCLNKNFAY